MTEERKDDVIVKKDELSEQELDKASGGGKISEGAHYSDPAVEKSQNRQSR